MLTLLAQALARFDLVWRADRCSVEIVEKTPDMASRLDPVSSAWTDTAFRALWWGSFPSMCFRRCRWQGGTPEDL